MDLGLSDKVCLVTGASSGIGRAIACCLSAEGANVALVGRDRERLEESAGGCADDARTMLVEGDLRDAEDLCSVAARVAAWRGKLDVVIHSAGVFVYKSIRETSVDEFDDVLAINVRAAHLLLQASVEHLAPGSAVVLVSSNLGSVGLADTTAYSASKGAVDALVRAAAVELAPSGVRVNAVAPGYTRTPMTYRLEDPDLRAVVERDIPLGRLGEPHEVARAAAFLSSPASSYITGAVLTADGGLSVS